MPHRFITPIDREDFAIMYPEPPQRVFAAAPADHISISPDSYYSRQQQHHQQHVPQTHDFHPATMPFDTSAIYAEATHISPYGGLSPALYPDEGCAPELRLPSSTLSVGSAPSSAVGSPRSAHDQPQSGGPEWQHHHGGLIPGIVGQGDYFSPTGEYSYAATDFPAFEYGQQPHSKPGFVADPSLIHPGLGRPMEIPGLKGYPSLTPTMAYPSSPVLTNGGSPHLRQHSTSPLPYVQANTFHHGPYGQFPAAPQSAMDAGRRQSIPGFFSATADVHSSDEAATSAGGREKQRCPHPECGKIFKDLKAHILTHQSERPEKCPIQTCDYHIKGFARKYDKNRHTLTHYKGTMVCGFCPGSGSAAEKSFNRADVFKRHLTAVHGVEQTPPNSRKKTGGATGAQSAAAKRSLSSYAPDATGKCSTCSGMFSNAQEFYEHLDDCVLRIVQQEDPAEAVNERRLAEVADDKDVHATLGRNNLPTSTTTVVSTSESDEDDDEAMMDDDEDDGDYPKSASPTASSRKKANDRSRGMTHSRIGRPNPAGKTGSNGRGRKGRREYPASWGFDRAQMTLKKRVIAAFDGPRRLIKDELMLGTDQEVRLPLEDGSGAYYTDLDMYSVGRAEGFHGATEAEKGPWISDDPTAAQREMMARM